MRGEEVIKIKVDQRKMSCINVTGKTSHVRARKYHLFFLLQEFAGGLGVLGSRS